MNTSIKSTHLFAYIGNNESAKEEALEQAVEQWLGDQKNEVLSRETFFGTEIKWETIAESYESVSMFSEQKAIILKQFEKVPLASQTKLADLFKLPNNNTAVFVLAEKWDGRSKLKKLFQKNGQIQEFKLPYSNQIPRWLCSRSMEKFKRKLSIQDATYLWECLGDDVQELEHELAKLNLFLPEGDPITAEVIEKVVIPHRNINMFELQKYMGLRNKAKTLTSLHSVIEQGDPAFLIAIRLYNHFLKLLKIRSLLEKGMQAEKIADMLLIRQYIFKHESYIKQAMSRSPQLLQKILSRLAKLEMKFKQGKYSQRFEIEMAFISLL
jgi:DNA polymerase-3 subunit delta